MSRPGNTGGNDPPGSETPALELSPSPPQPCSLPCRAGLPPPAPPGSALLAPPLHPCARGPRGHSHVVTRSGPVPAEVAGGFLCFLLRRGHAFLRGPKLGGSPPFLPVSTYSLFSLPFRPPLSQAWGKALGANPEAPQRALLPPSSLLGGPSAPAAASWGVANSRVRPLAGSPSPRLPSPPPQCGGGGDRTPRGPGSSCSRPVPKPASTASAWDSRRWAWSGVPSSWVSLLTEKKKAQPESCQFRSLTEDSSLGNSL